MSKRGQLAVFVVLAIILVAAIVLIFAFRKDIGEVFTSEVSPNQFLRDCVKEDVSGAVDVLSRQGGYEDPQGFVMYEGKPVKYLCYTAQYYKTCNIQQPLLREKFERELSQMLETRANECVQELKGIYESEGYQVTAEQAKISASIVPNNIIITFEAPFTAKKGDDSQNFRRFRIDYDSSMYDLIMISSSIVNYEATYGDSEVTLYTQYYPDLRIEKMKLGDGSTVYTVSNVVTGDWFRFASRSLAWPAGYGTEVT